MIEADINIYSIKNSNNVDIWGNIKSDIFTLTSDCYLTINGLWISEDIFHYTNIDKSEFNYFVFSDNSCIINSKYKRVKNLKLSITDIETLGFSLDNYLENIRCFYIKNNAKLLDNLCWSGKLAFSLINEYCFGINSMIKTDDCYVKIQELKSDKHNLLGQKVKLVCKNLYKNNYLVKFNKDSLGKNIPNKDTVVGYNNKIFINNIPKEANKLINNTSITRINYNKEYVYNILLEKRSKINVNNLISESLIENSKTSKISTHLPRITYKDKIKLISDHNDSFKKENLKNIIK